MSTLPVALDPREHSAAVNLQAVTLPAQYLTFTLAEEEFAIGILGVKEIVGYGGLTSVPMMPTSIRGVMNLRGAVVPVMDLMARFGRKPTPVTKRTCIVIIEVGTGDDSHVMGALVDTVNAVLDIASSEIEPPPSFGNRVRPDFIDGMGKVSGRFVILLDVEKVMAIDELSALAASNGFELQDQLVGVAG